jgi:hypothetical protein
LLFGAVRTFPFGCTVGAVVLPSLLLLITGSLPLVGLPVPEGFVFAMPEFLPGSAVPMPLLLFPEPRTEFVAASIDPLFEVAVGLTFTLVFPMVGLGSEVLTLPTTVGDSLEANLPPVRP